MAISSVNNQTNPYIQTKEANSADLAKLNPNQAQAVEKKDDIEKQASLLSKNEQRDQYRAQMIAHLFGDESTRDSNALRILYQEAVEQLNEMLAPEFGANAISQERLDAQGGMEYWTPENTADRIVAGTTAFFEGFQKQNPGLEGEELIDAFLEKIGGGIEKGFSEATNILEGFGVYEGSIKENAEKTNELVKQGLADFKQAQMEAMGLAKPKQELETVAE